MKDSTEQALPLPAASAQLRQAITDAPAEAQEAAMAIVLTTAQQWHQSRNEVDTLWAEDVQTLVGQTGVEISTGTLAGVPVFRLQPATVEPSLDSLTMLYLHGGAYYLGAGRAGLVEAVLIAHRVGIPVISVDYRMPPDDPFPAAVDDVLSVWKALQQDQATIGALAIGGSSAGGGLALAAVSALSDQGLPMPQAMYLGTPWVDLTSTGDSRQMAQGVDRILVTQHGNLAASARLYAGSVPLDDPRVSPIYGTWSNFPPTLLISGSRDLLLSDTARAQRKLRLSGGVAQLQIFEGLSHAEYMIATQTPESHQVYQELKLFLIAHSNREMAAAAAQLIQ